MKKAVIILLSLACVTACRFSFDISNNAEPGAYMQAIFSPEKISLNCAYAAHLGTAPDEFPPLLVNNLEISANGQDIEITREGNIFRPSRPFEEGEEIAINAECNREWKLKSSARIPAKAELAEASMTVQKMMGVKINTFEIRLKRQPVDGEFIAIEVERDTMRHRTAAADTLVRWASFQLGLDPISARDVEAATTAVHDDGSINDSRNQKGEHQIIVMPAAAFRDAGCSLVNYDMSEIVVPGISPQPVEPKPIPEDIFITYTVKVQAVSEEFYRYSLAAYKARTDMLGQMGLAPAQFAWSNINGGFGVCAAVNTASTITYSEAEFIRKPSAASEN